MVWGQWTKPNPCLTEASDSERGEGVSKGWIPKQENEGGLGAGFPTCWSSCPRTGGQDMGSQGEGQR